MGFNQKSHSVLATATAWLVLAAVACGTFAVFYYLNGMIVGRDSGYHAIQFYHSFFSSGAPVGTSSLFDRMFTPNYGPAIKLFTLPLWWAFGSFPWVFGFLNLIMFFVTMVFLQKILRVLNADSHWILVLGILILYSPMGLTMYQHYNVDAMTTLAAMFPLLLFLDKSRKYRCDFLLVGLVITFGLFVRMNVCFYLVVPLAYEFISCFHRRKGLRWFPPGHLSYLRIAGWVVLLILTGVVIDYYWPRMGEMIYHIRRTNDFNLEHTAIVSGLWTLDNWTWFLRNGFKAFPFLWSIVSIPVAILGWWKGFRGCHFQTIVYATVPIVLYSFILGTRKVEYIAPSLILWQLCAVMGIGYVKWSVVRWTLITLLLVCSISQMWWSLFGMSPCVYLKDQHTTKLLSREYTTLQPREKHVGVPYLTHNILNLAYPEKETLRIGIANNDSSLTLVQAPGVLQPFFENTDKNIDQVIFHKIDEMDCSDLDAILLLEPDIVGIEEEKPQDKINGTCRRVAKIPTHKRHRVDVYLPWQ